MGDAEGDGISLLAEALRRQRLDSAENEFRYRSHLRALENQLQQTTDLLQEAQHEAESQKERADALERGSSTRFRIQERRDWMRQVCLIREDRDRLKSENEALVAKLAAGKAAEAQGLAGAVRKAVLENGHNGAPSTSRTRFLGPEEGGGEASAAEWMALVNELQAELQSTREELAEAQVSIDALRLKLNIELEQKFEREHQPPNLLVRLYDSFEYTVAPPPKPRAPLE